MKIIYVDILYDYGRKEQGFNLIGQEGFLKNLLALGYEVFPFYYDEYLNIPNYGTLQKDLIKFCDEIKPDIIFHLTVENQFTFETLDYLKLKYTTVAWFGDDTWRFDNYSKNYANHYTYCITTDKFSIEKYRNIGQNNVIYSQWAAINTPDMPDFNKKYEFDVSFVGGRHPVREWFIRELERRGIKVHTFGHGWENGAVSGSRMNEIFTVSKINLNLSNSVNYDLRYVLENNRLSSLNPFIRLKEIFKTARKVTKCIKHRKNQEQIKARNFEIPYFNGFQLSYYYPALSDYFNIGKEIACFSNIDEAELLIRYYLQNEEERETIKKSGHEAVINKHDYKNRLEDIFKILSDEILR